MNQEQASSSTGQIVFKIHVILSKRGLSSEGNLVHLCGLPLDVLEIAGSPTIAFAGTYFPLYATARNEELIVVTGQGV